MKIPPYLQPGDTIGIVCPAGFMPAEKAKACIQTLKKWGYKVVKGKTLGGRSKNYFSGTDEERLYDLQSFLDDPSINAILCGRGGYGTTRILDGINWKAFKQQGKVKAAVIGGNLCLMAHSIGSNAEYDTDGKILFMEDIGEQLYNIDRMMLQLKRAGKLKKLKGLIVGGFTDNKDTERTFGKTAYAIIAEAVQEYNYPKCFGFPISHEKENVAIAIGQTYALEIGDDAVSLFRI